MQPQNASTLGGLLSSIVVPITSAQLLKLPGTPIPLMSGGAGAILLRSVIASLKFKTSAYAGGAGSAALFYAGPSRYAPAAPVAPLPENPYAVPGGVSKWINFQITAVAASVGGNTVYTVSGLTTLPTNVLIGYQAIPQLCSHSQNNGTFTIVASTQSTITLNNASGILETSSPAGATMEVDAAVSLIGGIGTTIDLTPLLTTAINDYVQGWGIDSWILPTSEIVGAGLFLGSPAAGLSVPPTNLTSGDSALTLTVEYFNVIL
jgi:hypothetical protein